MELSCEFQDFTALHDNHWKGNCVRTRPSVDITERIKINHAGDQNPGFQLVAHHYTRLSIQTASGNK
jgi:hypothetical protein